MSENMLKISFQCENEDRIKVLNFLNTFPNEDIFCEAEEDHLNIFLNSLNYFDFEEKILKLISEENSSETTRLLFTNIYERINNIRSYGLRGKKRVYVGYNKERKVVNRANKSKQRKPYFYANDDNFSKTINNLPEEFINKIVTADSEEFLKRLPDNCIDLIFTSPPYNFGLEYGESEDAHFWDNYFGKLFNIFDQCIRVLKFGGRIIVNIQPLFSDYIPSHHILSNYFMKKKMIWKAEILWEKNNYNCKYTAWGSWKSPSSPYLKYTWEFLEVFAKGDLSKRGLPENIDITADEFKKWVLAKWSIAPERNMKSFGHPAMFPEELVVRSLKLFSYQNDIILDPFNGVGTTSVVAKKLNRAYLGIDISEEYCDVAKKRVDSILL
jgi:DNA modification methylase